MQQQAALMNIQIAKFKDYNDRDDPIKESPPTNNMPISIEWVAYF